MNNKELINEIVEKILNLSLAIYKENDNNKAYELHQLSHKLKKLLK